MSKSLGREPRRMPPDRAGMIEPSMDPMRTIGMEMAFYRGSAGPHYRHPILRIASMVFGVMLTLGSGFICFPTLIFAWYSGIRGLTVIPGILLELLFFLLGIRIIFMNIKHKNSKRS